MSYTIKICKECGQEFVPDSPRQIYCKREHYRPCPICGKPVKAVYLNEAPRCCSSICRTIKAKEAGTTKVCEICGKRFKVFGTQRYCPEPHFRPCPVCGKPVEYHKRSDPIQCCSSECKAELRKRTISTKLKVCKICGKEFKSESNTAKYCPGPHYRPCPICGKPVEFHSLSEPVRCCSSECKEKQKEKTCLVRYGEDVAAKSEAVRAKIQETCNSEPVVSKRISSCIAKYGVQNPAMAIEVRNKIRKTNLSTKSKKRYTLSMQSHYGVNFPMQSNVLKQKQFDTCQKRYNVPYACMLEQCRQKNHFIISNINKKVAEILKSYNIDVELEHKIDKYSYDIYLPKFKTFIEVNPTYTHNSVGNHWNSEGLDKYYHLEKTKTANEAGFRCIHLFDWDKIDMIADFFRSKQVVYARKCSICNIDKNLAGEFLSNHHLQGAMQRTGNMLRSFLQ